MKIFKSLATGEIVNDKNEVIEHLVDCSNRPHCFGEMNWILKYEMGEEPRGSICSNCCSNSCMKLTREINSVKG